MQLDEKTLFMGTNLETKVNVWATENNCFAIIHHVNQDKIEMVVGKNIESLADNVADYLKFYAGVF